MYRGFYLFLATVIFVGTTSVVQAYQATLETFAIPYEVVTIANDPNTEQLLLGELAGAPEMYEIVADHEFNLTVEIRAVPNAMTPVPEFSGIIIRQKEKRGVEEVSRLKGDESNWDVLTDGTTGLRYQAGPFFSEKVPAGTYRIEVSTPENAGKYILVVGSVPDNQGYFATLGTIATMYEFYGLSKMRMFSSPYVHYPVGIIILIGLMTLTWYYQRLRKRHA